MYFISSDGVLKICLRVVSEYIISVHFDLINFKLLALDHTVQYCLVLMSMIQHLLDGMTM
jgi:hypothetical protein